MGIGPIGGHQPWIKPGVNSSSQASPGVGGAVSDFIQALAQATPTGQKVMGYVPRQTQAIEAQSQ